MDDPSDTAVKARAGEPYGPARYEDDLYSWAVEQAALLRAGRVTEADAKNIAEELDDVGNEQYDKLESALRIILMHLLKWDYQPERRTRSWRLSIAVQRNHVEKILRKNPGLKPHIDEATADAYRNARLEAADETGLDENTFPVQKPYSWEDIMERQVE